MGPPIKEIGAATGLNPALLYHYFAGNTWPAAEPSSLAMQGSAVISRRLLSGRCHWGPTLSAAEFVCRYLDVSRLFVREMIDDARRAEAVILQLGARILQRLCESLFEQA